MVAGERDVERLRDSAKREAELSRSACKRRCVSNPSAWPTSSSACRRTRRSCETRFARCGCWRVGRRRIFASATAVGMDAPRLDQWSAGVKSGAMLPRHRQLIRSARCARFRNAGPRALGSRTSTSTNCSNSVSRRCRRQLRRRSRRQTCRRLRISRKTAMRSTRAF